MGGYNALPGIHSHMRAEGQALPMDDMRPWAIPAGLDCRVRLAASLAGTLASFLLKSEPMLGVLAAECVLWLCALKQVKAGLAFAMLYGLLTYALQTTTTQIAVGSLLVLANVFRRIMIPAFMAIPLGKAPTGVMIASFNRLRIPRQAIIALAIMFRFMPTVSEEYMAIRISQKFRGIGVTAWNILRHPGRCYETILVPLLIRTTRIADELSASAILRGAAAAGDVTSLRTIALKRFDVLCLMVIILLPVGMLGLELFWRLRG